MFVCRIRPILIVSLLVSQFATANSEELRHSFLGVGKANGSVIVGEDGKVKWKVDLPASDGWVQPNGNVLLAVYPTSMFPRGGVVEINRDTKEFLFADSSSLSRSYHIGNTQ